MTNKQIIFRIKKDFMDRSIKDKLTKQDEQARKKDVRTNGQKFSQNSINDCKTKQ